VNSCDLPEARRPPEPTGTQRDPFVGRTGPLQQAPRNCRSAERADGSIESTCAAPTESLERVSHDGRDRRARACRLPVVEFPGSDFNGEILPELADLVQRGIVRVLDLVVIKNDADGSYEAFEFGDPDAGPLGEIRELERELADLLGEDDVMAVAETLEPDSAAGLLVYENLWAAPLPRLFTTPAGNSWRTVASLDWATSSHRLRRREPSGSGTPGYLGPHNRAPSRTE